MRLAETSAELARHWLYDWNGANMNLFLVVHRGLPDGWTWLPEFLSWIGAYWGAPAVLCGLLLWRWTQRAAAPRLLEGFSVQVPAGVGTCHVRRRARECCHRAASAIRGAR